MADQGTGKKPFIQPGLSNRGQQSHLFDSASAESEASEAYRVALREMLRSKSASADSSTANFKRPSQAASAVNRKRIFGVVVSAKTDKTIVVKSDRDAQHRLYVKKVRHTKKFHAHDEFNLAKEGDFVRIVECRPLSKLKCWRLEEVLRRPGLLTQLPSWLRTPPMIRLSIPGLESDNLVHDQAYRLKLHLENEQFRLFERKMTEAETGDDINAQGQPSHHAEVKCDLIVRLGGRGFETRPGTVTIRTGQKGPIIDPPEVSLVPMRIGEYDFNLSILLANTGELVQSQTFTLKVR